MRRQRGTKGFRWRRRRSLRDKQLLDAEAGVCGMAGGEHALGEGDVGGGAREAESLSDCLRRAESLGGRGGAGDVQEKVRTSWSVAGQLLTSC
eukprot:747949-Hanusia_phi.AAC.5